MKFKIKTSKGIYTYKFAPVFQGIKRIDKVKAKENLLLFNRIAKRNGLRFGIIYGTLLGALREHDFIAHDEDIDCFILMKDLDVLKSMLFELRENGFEVIRFDRREGLLSIMRNGEYIDFYIYDDLCEGFVETMGFPVPAKYVKDLALYDFQGDKFWAAKDWEEFFIMWYGLNWNTPVQTNNYEMSWLQKKIWLIKWYVFYTMPKFIFKYVMKKRDAAKIVEFNNRLARREKAVGHKIMNPIPEGVCKITK